LKSYLKEKYLIYLVIFNDELRPLFFFWVHRQNNKAIINLHTQVGVPGFEPRSWHLA